MSMGNTENNKYGIVQSALYFCVISIVLSIAGMIFMGVFNDAGRMTLPLGLLLGCAISYVATSFFICKNKIVATIRAILCCVLLLSLMILFMGNVETTRESEFLQSLFSGLFFFSPLIAWLLVDGLIRLWESRKNGTAELSGFIILTLITIAIPTYTILKLYTHII